MRLGKQMQFFGARVNLAKALLYAINGGRDEVTGDQVAPPTLPVAGDFLDYDDVMAKFDATMEWLAKHYVHAMNCIHYMHDKYFYERLEMALHDRDILAERWHSGSPGFRSLPTASARSSTENACRPRRDRIDVDYQMKVTNARHWATTNRVDPIAGDW